MGAYLSSYWYPALANENEETSEVKDVQVQTPTAGLSFSRIFSVTDEKVVTANIPLSLVGLDDLLIGAEEEKDDNEVAKYCLPLIVLHFCGQTSSLNDKNSDKQEEGKRLLTLNNYLRMLDKFIRQHEVEELRGDEDEYMAIMMLIATKRYQKRQETVQDCYQRLMDQSKRFIKVYHKRGKISPYLETKTFWGSRQQLLAGKVIGDWIDRENGPLDPIFGVILSPTAGLVGRGETDAWMHSLLFDDRGYMAYHSAVHDGFGYLITEHGVGPGYNYLSGSTYLHTDNPLAGQVSGISFWRDIIEQIKVKQKVLDHWRC